MGRVRAVLALSALLACGGVPPLPEAFEAPGGGAVIRVPEEQPSIQAGVDAASDGDTVLVAPGFYFEKVQIRGKRISVGSWYLASRDPVHRAKTVISSRGAAFDARADGETQSDVRIAGFTLRNGKFGVVASSSAVLVEDNRIYANADGGIVGSNVRLVVSGNEIRDHREGVGIALAGVSTLLAEDNRFDRNGTAVYMDFHYYEGDLLDLRIRGNEIVRSTLGGVVMMSYGGLSDRLVRIERNVFDRNASVAVECRERKAGMLPTAGAELKEPVFVVQNTFSRNAFGLIGGDNVVAMNNLFVGTREVAMLRLRESSVVDRNGFFDNGRDSEDVPKSRRLRAVNPQLDDELHLMSGSPYIDRGLTSYVHQGTVVLPVGSYEGEAPDLGAFER